MACEDTRQLTEAQRVAGYQQQRTGVPQAVRPFTGRPTLDNLLDYINRELVPAVRQTRNAVNETYNQVRDNAPSGNPLQFYFSTETANADPTTGFIRLDAATQDTATTIRVSQTNGRLQDVAAWLDVMAGGATTPLGTITLFDAINPGRFLRFDLSTMVDQGAYWDLGVTIIESSHDNPFVDGGGLVVSFIPAVASSGATVPPGAITPIAANTVLGNPTASSAAPTEIAVPVNSVVGRVAGNIVVDRIVTDQIADNQVDNTKIRNSSGLSVIGRASNTSGDPADIAGTASSDAVLRISGTTLGFGQVATAGIANDAVTNEKLRNSGALSVIGRASNSAGDPADIAASGGLQFLQTNAAATVVGWGTLTLAAFPAQASDTVLGNISGSTAVPSAVALADLDSTSIVYDATSHTFQRAALTGAITASQNGNGTLFDTNASGAGLTGGGTAVLAVGAGTGVTVNANDIAVTIPLTDGDKGDITVATNGTVWTVDNDAITNAKLANVTSPSLKGRTTASTGDPEDLTLAASTSITWNTASGGSISLERAALTGDVTASANSNATTIANDAVTNAKLANMAQSTIKGRAESAGTGDPTDLTPTQVAAIIDGEVFSWSANHTFGAQIILGTQQNETGALPLAITLNETTTRLYVLVSGTGDIQTITPSGGATTAGRVVLVYIVGSGTKTIRHAFSGGGVGQIQCPNNVNFVVGNRDSFLLIGDGANGWLATNIHSSFQALTDGDKGDVTVATNGTVWTVDNSAITLAKMANLAAGTVIGRQIDAGTGVPVALTGAEQAENLRFNTVVPDTTSTGAQATYTVAADTTEVLCNTSGAVEIQGISIPTTVGQRVVFHRQVSATGAWTFRNNSASAGALQQRLLLANAQDVVLGDQQSLVLEYTNNRWRQIGGSVSGVSDGDKGDITVSSSGATWTIDNDAVTTAKILNANVTLAKLANQNDDTFLANISGSSGPPSAVALTTLAGAGLTGGADAVLNVGAGTGITVNANDIAVTIPLTDGDKGDITVSSSGATWTIDNNVVSNAKLRDSAALSVIGHTSPLGGDPADIQASNDGEVLRRSGTSLGFGTIATAGITDAAVTLAKMENRAQSTIIGRAEGAGTGVPQALTPTQVVAIIDGESATWTGDHTFTGTNFITGVSGDVRLGATSGIGLFANVTVANVIDGDLVLNAASGVGISAGAGAITSVPAGTLDIDATAVDIDATGNVTVDTTGNITIASSGTGTTTVTGGSNGLILTAGSTIDLNSPHTLNNVTRLTSILTSTMSANIDNLDVSNVNVVRLSPNSGALRLRGMVAGGDGQLVLLLNTSTANTFNIIDESDTVDGTSSTAANRFRLPSTTTQSIPTSGAVWMWYDGATDRWRMR